MCILQVNHQKTKATELEKRKKVGIAQQKKNRIMYIKEEFNIKNWLNRFWEN